MSPHRDPSFRGAAGEPGIQDNPGRQTQSLFLPNALSWVPGARSARPGMTAVVGYQTTSGTMRTIL